MGALDPRVPELLMGLAPAPAGACRRCGASTRGLANGRGRLDICGGCGTVEVQTPEGLELLSLKHTPLGGRPLEMRRRLDPYRL